MPSPPAPFPDLMHEYHAKHALSPSQSHSARARMKPQVLAEIQWELLMKAFDVHYPPPLLEATSAVQAVWIAVQTCKKEPYVLVAGGSSDT